MTILPHKIQVYESRVGAFIITGATRNPSFKSLSLPRKLQLLQTTSLPYKFHFYHWSRCLCLTFNTHSFCPREKRNKWALRGDGLGGQTIASQCLSQRAALFPLPVFSLGSDLACTFRQTNLRTTEALKWVRQQIACPPPLFRHWQTLMWPGTSIFHIQRI